MSNAAHLLLAMALCGSGCSGAASPTPIMPSPVEPSPVEPSPTSVYAGRFTGRTTQGGYISLKVSPAQTVTVITVEYRMQGGTCNGLVAYTGWSLDIEVPESGNPHFSFSHSGPDNKHRINVTGEFTSSETAVGQVSFYEFFGCGNATANWTATKASA